MSLTNKIPKILNLWGFNKQTTDSKELEVLGIQWTSVIKRFDGESWYETYSSKILSMAPIIRAEEIHAEVTEDLPETANHSFIPCIFKS